MANELQRLNNPTNVPEAVSTGYQRQNTALYALMTGLDTTEPYDTTVSILSSSGNIIIPVGGLVEVNGSLFKISSQVTLAKPVSSRYYWVAVYDNGNGYASLSLVDRPGDWNPAKKGCYRTDNARTLNWVSYGFIPSGAPEQVFYANTKGWHTYKIKKGWYIANVTSGLGDGAGEKGSSSTSGNVDGGAGGVASKYVSSSQIFFQEYNTNLVIRVGGSGGNGGNGGDGIFKDTGSTSGGGGGSGSGEPSEIVGLISSGKIKAGEGGAPGLSSLSVHYLGGGGGSPGGTRTNIVGTKLAAGAGKSGGSGWDGILEITAAANAVPSGNLSPTHTHTITVSLDDIYRYTIAGGSYGGIRGYSGKYGAGGGQGLDGEDREDGTPGGSVTIWMLNK
jgi:hypothetical protein